MQSRVQEPSVGVEKLTKAFGDFVAVEDLDFSVRRGEVVGFLGPNGAGKSTTMKMITGYLAPTRGRARVCGLDVGERPLAAKACVGYLPEGAPLYGDMSARGFLRFVAAVRGLRGSTAARRIDEVVERMELGAVLRQPIETLSKGFKRRVGLAQAILHDPPVLVLDEPTDGLDPNQKFEVRGLIREVAADKVIVISTHILEEVDAVCSRALLIASGRLLADDTPAALMARSAYHNAVVLELAAPAPHAAAQLEALPGVERGEWLGDAEGTRLRLYPRDGAAIGPAVLAAAREQELEVRQMYVEQGRLDDVFRSLTREVDGRETRS